MFFSQIYTDGLAHCSYVIGGKEQCVVVDPSRDTRRCMAAAKSFGLPVTAVLETHLHADFVSGHMDLKELGATVYAPKAARCDFDHVPLADGETVTIDTLRITLMETPGHTPEGASYVVSDLSRGPEPALLLSGDTLFVGDVGRPDLFPDIKERLAGQLHDSLGKIRKLPDRLEVYPAHGMGSLCGRALSAKLSSTIGTEKLHNAALKEMSRQEFSNLLLTGMPEAPDHFARCSEINRRGPTPVAELPSPRPLSPSQFQALVASGHVVVDVRDQLAFAGAHIPGAYHISTKTNFATFAGWVVPPDRPLCLVVDSPDELALALVGLRHVGLDQIVAYLDGGMTAWANAGLETSRIETVSIPELNRMMGKQPLLVVDTRLGSEWSAGRIPNTIHVPAPDVRIRQDWSVDEPVVVICNTGNRSSIAASLLKQRGFSRVINAIGGTTAWQAAGYSWIGGDA